MAGDYEYFAAQVKVAWLVDLSKPYVTLYSAWLTAFTNRGFCNGR